MAAPMVIQRSIAIPRQKVCQAQEMSRRTGGWSRRRRPDGDDIDVRLGLEGVMADVLNAQESERDQEGANDSDNDSSDDGDSNAAAEAVVDELLYGALIAKIVKNQYKGTLNENEMVALQREPGNTQNEQSIRVKTVLGSTVGYLNPEVAAGLSKIVDANMARIEGIVPIGVNSMHQFSVSLDILIYGTADNQQIVRDTLRHYGLFIEDGYGAAETASKNAVIDDDPHAHTPRSAEEAKYELDTLFENLREEDKTEQMEPCDAIRTKLYPHQKMALAWMWKRENKDELPPFWQKNHTRNNYFNEATGYSTVRRPRPIRGGILADDMGLGKTLETIALIFSSFRYGKPLLIPTAQTKTRMTGLEGTNQSKRGRYATSNKTTLPKRVLPASSSVVDALFSRMQNAQEHTDPQIVDGDKGTSGCSDSDSDVAGCSSSSTTKRRRRRSLKRPKIVHGVAYNSVVSDGDSDVENTENGTLVDLIDSDVETASVDQTDPASFDSEDDLPDMDESPVITKGLTKSASKSSAVPELKRRSSARLVSRRSNSPASANAQQVSSAFDKQDYDEKGRCLVPGSRVTLIVCPLSVMSNWITQIDEHLHQNVHPQVAVYYGSLKAKFTSKDLADKDVVLTTYSTLASAYQKQNDPLMKVEWFRVVLDEGHYVRNPQSVGSKAVLELKAERRWVVTGTPVQNYIKDLYSIVRFLGVDPFRDRGWWKRIIENPLGRRERVALKRVRCLMKNLAMRRLKTQELEPGRPLVELPPRRVVVEHVEFTDEERKLYDDMRTTGSLTVSRYYQEGTLLHHYGQVLAILLRLRQLCLHPFLLKRAAENAKQRGMLIAEEIEHGDLTEDEAKKKLLDHLKEILSSGIDEECPVCMDSLKHPVVTVCAHVYCRECIMQVINTERPNSKCPLCRRALAEHQLVEPEPEPAAPEPEEEKAEELEGDWRSSSKVDAVLKHLINLRTEDPSIKSIIISQFTTLLDLLEIVLNKEEFSFVRLDGSMSAGDRAEAMTRFAQVGPKSPTVFLLSLKAGGVGINLTSASRVFLMDPAYNPAAEEQCFDRCHRLGQTREVIITKFIIRDTVEEAMIEIQERKREMFQGAFGVGNDLHANADARREQRIDDILRLMNIHGRNGRAAGANRGRGANRGGRARGRRRRAMN